MMRILIATLIAVGALAGPASAQSFPDRPITLINHYAAVGPSDPAQYDGGTSRLVSGHVWATAVRAAVRPS